MQQLRGLKVIRLLWDRAAAVVCAVVAVVMLIVGWISLSEEVDPGEQIPYIMSAGIGGLFLLCIGITLWLSADLRDEWRKLDVIDETLRQLANSSGDVDLRSSAAKNENGGPAEPSAPGPGQYALTAQGRRVSERMAGRRQEAGWP